MLQPQREQHPYQDAARLPAGVVLAPEGGLWWPGRNTTTEGHMTEIPADLLFDAKGQLSESPQWSSAEQALYWVDIGNGLLHRFDWGPRSHECVAFRAPVTMVVPGPPLLVTSGNSLLRFDWNTRESQLIAGLPLDPARVRFNDGKLDPGGRLWLGTMAIDEKSPIAALYRLVGTTLERVLAGVSISNGIVWHGDTMYYVDSATSRVDAFDYAAARGALDLDSRRTVLEFREADGPPDGMALDVDGNLWIALVKGKRVSCFSPDSGEELARVAVNAANVSACCFGGPDMKHLIISTGKAGPDDPPGSGALFVAAPGARGVVSPTPQGIA
jgi:sugar lactone lactonase YvrE